MSVEAMAKHLLLVGVTLMGASVFAQAPESEPALARSAKDPQLQWSPCPSFMPAGCGLAVLHGDPAKPNADAFFKLSAGSVIPEHWHTSAERMVLIEGEITANYKGQAPVVLKPGMYAYGPAKLPHSASCGASGRCVLFIAFELPVDAVLTAAPAAGTAR